MDDLRGEMQRRIWRNMLITPLGVIGIMSVGFGLAVAIKQIFHPVGVATGGTMISIVVCSVAGFVGALGFGLWSASKYLRCPACEENIWMYLSWKLSLFSGAVGNQCPKCGVELFSPVSTRRVLRLLLILVGASVAVMLAGATLSYLATKHKHAVTAPK